MRKWTFLTMIFHGSQKWKKQHYQKLTTTGFAITSTLLLKNSKPLRQKFSTSSFTCLNFGALCGWRFCSLVFMNIIMNVALTNTKVHYTTIY